MLNDVCVIVKVIGFCGLDFYYYNYFCNGDIFVCEFLILGYELVGIVIVVGLVVINLFFGDKVVFEVG